MGSPRPWRSTRRPGRLRRYLKFDCHIWGRNCDRAVERSTALEAVDQVLALRLGDAGQLEIDARRVEQVDVGADRRAGVLRRFDRRAHSTQRHVEPPGQYLN